MDDRTHGGSHWDNPHSSRRNVRDFGAVGDGATDDTAAFRAALASAGVGGGVHVPLGVYRLSGPIETPMFSVVEGTTTEFGVGAAAATELRFTGDGPALGVNASLRNIVVRGPGHTTATTGVSGASVRLERVTLAGWGTGCHLTDGYYAQLSEVEWNRNARGLVLTGCYNVNLYGPRFSCQLDTVPQSYGVAIAGAARGLNIFGGSIENYRLAIGVGSAQQVNLVGVYFETAVDANAYAIAADGRDKVTVVATGCFVYLNGHRAWVTTSGSTQSMLVANGNHFVAVEASAQVPTAYIVTTGQDVAIGPDNWWEVAKLGASYVYASAGSLSDPGIDIHWPRASAA